MTKIDGYPSSDQAIPGMAFFAGTGPEGKTCGDCKHRGYYRQSQRPTWNEARQEEVYRSYRVTSCAVFKKMAGHHGTPVEKDCKACKYFEQKPKSQ